MKLSGTMLTPGVSKNGRLYTPELIAKACARLTERIAAGDAPVTMLTHHAAGDNSVKIVGRVTAVRLNGENLDYDAELADTHEAATIGALVSPDKPFLRNVSIRGWWLGPELVKTVNGETVTTGDDLEIDGLDFTRSPGVTGATVFVAAGSGTAETAPRNLICENVEARAVFTEETALDDAAAQLSALNEAGQKAPYGNVQYADPGYQSDKKKRYPIDTKAHAKAAWSYINQKDNADLYTAAQLKRVRGRIKAALKRFGVTVTAESLAGIASTAPEVHMLTESDTTLSEVTECYDPTGTAGFSISAYNGPLTVTISAYNGIEPADLGSVAQAAMCAACDAIHALDPDDDGDIDTGADSDASASDNDMESATEKENPVTEATEATPAAETVDTPTDEATETAAEQTEATESDGEAAPQYVTADQLAEAVTAAVTAALAGQGEQSPATEEQAEAALRAQIRDEIIAEARKSGSLTRKGLVETMGEPDKPLHEMDDDELRAYAQSRSGLFFAHNPQ